MKQSTSDTAVLDVTVVLPDQELADVATATDRDGRLIDILKDGIGVGKLAIKGGSIMNTEHDLIVTQLGETSEGIRSGRSWNAVTLTSEPLSIRIDPWDEGSPIYLHGYLTPFPTDVLKGTCR